MSDASSVWPLYDKLRTARLNVKYYCRRLEFYERVNFVLEAILLASAPSSAIAGLWFWNTEIGSAMWKAFGVVAASAALLKPLISPVKRIKEYEGVLSGYRVLEFDLLEIKALVEQKGRYDAVLQAEFKRALQRERTLVAKNPETRESSAVKRECEAEVNRELPADAFFVPKE